MAIKLRPVLVYFGLVFAAGFVLGTIRVLVVAPVLGERNAELFEMPLMVMVSWFAARFVLKRFTINEKASGLLTGMLALALLLLLEFTLVLNLRGITVEQYFTGRDPMALGAYFFGLLLFGLMPWLLMQGKRN